MPTPPPRIADDAVFSLTERGEQQLKGGRTDLSTEALEVLVLVDGRSSAIALMSGMPVMAPAAVREKLGELLAAGMIRSKKEKGGVPDISYIDAGDFFKTIGKPVRLTPAQAAGGAEAAAAGLSSLQESGFYVSIAHRAKSVPAAVEGRHRVVLIVEDDPDICNLLSIFLRQDNFDIVVAKNKAEVLEALRNPRPPDLALLDVNLPDVDGFHILSRMRQHPVLKAVPIIMLTASATRNDVLKGLHFGADGYVTKPFEFDTLIKAVHTVLGIA